MKKFRKLAALGLALIIAVGLITGPAAAADAETSARWNTVRIYVNDQQVIFPDVQPFIDSNGRTLVPVRFMTEAMGADVSWEQETHTAIIELNGVTVRVSYRSKDLVVIKDGVQSIVTMDTEAVGVNSRTCVPIRFVCEALGAYVDYSNLYNAVEIVTSDELTAEDIQRLRSYDMIQWWHTDLESDQWFVEKTEYKYFSDRYGFSNSHNYLLLSPDNEEIKYDVKSTLITKVTPGKISNYLSADAGGYAFMTFTLEHANRLLEYELMSYNEDTDDTNTASWTYHKAGWLDVTYNFRSCTNLIYQQICPPHCVLSVRGIMDVTFGEDTPKQWITDSFGIEDPEYGKTYSLDVEFDFVVDRYSYLTDAKAYYFTEDGEAHVLDKQPVANYHN